MTDFTLQILGTSSATPSYGRFSSAQVLHTHSKTFLIDCSDGTQYQLRTLGVKMARLGHVFISHLHGDHCYGLMAVLSTLSLLGHTADVHIHAHEDLEKLLRPQLDYFCKDLTFNVFFHAFNPLEHSLIYEDKSLEVHTIPLVHKMPTAGFLFKEKQGLPHINKAKFDFYNIPLALVKDIKNGADFVREDGRIVPNKELILPPSKTRSYAYCSDTAYSERIIPIIKGVDVLYHESTFMQADLARSKATLHSTAAQAATIAKKAEVGRLLLGHYSSRYANIEPLLAEAQSIFPDALLTHEGDIIKW